MLKPPRRIRSYPAADGTRFRHRAWANMWDRFLPMIRAGEIQAEPRFRKIPLQIDGTPLLSPRGMRLSCVRPFIIHWPRLGFPEWEPITDALLARMGFEIYRPPEPIKIRRSKWSAIIRIGTSVPPPPESP